ncbi:homeobox protein 2 [Chironomus tepperi]|uniref:homeobox protein 2 n=1 Tax=Chironomus tepperi TaxID=113505 RepID=UPI00391F3622
MTFQPWKQAFNNLPNQFYRNINNKNDSSDSASSTFNSSKMKNGDIEISGPSSVSNMNILSPQSSTSTSHPFDLNNEHYQSPVSASTNNVLIDNEPVNATNKGSLNGTKFSIFSQLINLNKINAFDNLLLNASMSLDDDDFSSDKRQGMRKLMEQAISDEAKQQIAFILEKISTLRPAEKLLLYLKMPGGHCEVDPLKQSQNPLGSRSEISHTINWVRSHLEQDDKVSIPKQEVYEDYVTFCGKINIKPLSTADFGKVMKQVFPDIRPRRLGTRGHSRYCYAAMRKATKLSTPQLPEIRTNETTSKKNNNNNGSGSENESTWKVIKNWSENLLGNQFESLDDLAEHISQNNLNITSISSTSKQVLQKKLMQREMKDRKRNNNQSIRKRRKKRRTSTTSSPEHTPEYYNTTSIQIKQEKETDGSAIENNDDHSENSSDVPMNLSNTEQSRRIKNEQTTSTNTLLQQGTSSQFLDNDTIKNKLKNKLMPIVEANDQKPEETQYNILCKKVRQAQQMKMSAAANVTNPVTSTVTSNLFVNPNNHPGSMHAPYTHNSLNNQQNLDHPNDTTILKPTSSKRKQKRETIQMMKRKLEESAAANDSPLNSVDSNELPLKEDFILPRERFISICNMDRNALDTYLNNSEENSQDLELLQYFGEDKNHNKNTDEKFIEEDLGPLTTTVPLLENYQLNFNENNNKCDRQNAEKIMQLRTILEEKYNTSCSASNAATSNDSVIKNLLLKNPHLQHHNHHHNHQQQQSMSNDGTDLFQATGMIGDHQHLGNFQMNSIQPNTVMSDKLVVPQSPNTRRKNFSFVPIPSQSSRVKNINLNPAFKSNGNGNANGNQPTSPFISPRVTPVLSKQPNNQQSLSVRSPNVSIDTSKNIPLLGVNNTAFCRPTHFKMEPSSAPPSPSMAPQNHFNFSPHSQQQQQQQFQFNNQNLAPHQQQGSTTNYNYPVESRSQSVPPHCTNNIYGGNNNATYNNYSSACSSMAATPVPSDYQEFNDTNILEIFNNEQPPLSSTIKMETNDDVISDLLDNDLLNQNSNHSESDSLLSGTMRPRFNSISRSVPCTPLPFHSNNNYTNVNGSSMNASVPNTPISNASNPFRYSPELQRTRDFLINGFNNNINHNNNIINKLSKAHDGTAGIDELDTNLLNNL